MNKITLDHRFTEMGQNVLLTGPQAIGRILINQWERDQAARLKTAGYVAGYRGSPLGTLDAALHKMRDHLVSRNIVVRPCVNEDIAATAVWGTQQAGVLVPSNYDGVFGLWYGKGPGVDRSVDALKHANLAGTAPKGGTLLIVGDDHVNKSSTTPHHSELSLMAAGIPVMHPSDLQEVMDFGILGYAMSRFAGLWVSQKVLSDTADSTAVVDPNPHRVQIKHPNFDFEGHNVHMSVPTHLSVSQQGAIQEKMLFEYRLPAAQAFWRANGFDRVTIAPKIPNGKGRVGIVTSGKSYHDVVEALRLLGISDTEAAEMGLGVLKLGMVWPIDASVVRGFAQDGYDDLLVVEEKRALIEPQLRDALYGSGLSPRVHGKSHDGMGFGARSGAGGRLFPAAGELTVQQIARAIAEAFGDTERGADLIAREQAYAEGIKVDESGDAVAKRTPFFCSGCPHNSSTKVPEGSIALGGVGCHVLALGMQRENVGFTHMGAEGANWIGLAHFATPKHVFQNMGDGTYFHSGYLTIRAAIASGVNMTFKILYNDAVAMTGGQSVDGDLSAKDVVWQMQSEGAVKIAVVADDPDRWAGVDLPAGVRVSARRDLLAVEEELREIKGTTILVYDQVCAAELRRRRKRGVLPDPDRRIFINNAICEGCGDCSKASNCISILPKATKFGTKREIEQSSCNKDTACVDGFCPSFVTVKGARAKPPVTLESGLDLPLPEVKPLKDTRDILIAGIGGTGVVTIGAVLAMAAHLDDMACTVMDMTGMAQKGGSVLSHVRFGQHAGQIASPRVNAGMADVLLACDAVVAMSEDTLRRTHPNDTAVFFNAYRSITGQFVLNPSESFDIDALLSIAQGRFGTDQMQVFNANAYAETLVGTAVGANMFMMGAAFQAGDIPVSLESIEEAITLNGVAVEMNKMSFQLGRLSVADRGALDALMASKGGAAQITTAPATEADCVAYLTAYQSKRYAKRYARAITAITASEARLKGQGAQVLRDAAVHSLFRLMAIKDEYEVARLMSGAEFTEKLRHAFGEEAKVTYNLAPPFLTRRDTYSGLPIKRQFGPWMGRVFPVLAAMKPLRGGMFDPFGYSAERRMERAIRDRFIAALAHIAATLDADRFEDAVAYVRLAGEIRGFGHVKEASVGVVAPEWQRLEALLGISTADQALT